MGFLCIFVSHKKKCFSMLIRIYIEKPTMSKERLLDIQQKLNSAIRSHHECVSKLKKDPKNVILQRALKQAQLEINRLSDQQKCVITELREKIRTTQAKREVEPQNRTITSPNRSPKQERKQHTPRPSILQGRRTVLRLPSETPVKSPPPPTDDASDIKASIGTSVLSPTQLQKIEYMASLSLVTRERLNELKRRRRERRKRSTARAQFSAHNHTALETVQNKTAPLNEIPQFTERRRGRPPLAGRAGIVPHQRSSPMKQKENSVCGGVKVSEDVKTSVNATCVDASESGSKEQDYGQPCCIVCGQHPSSSPSQRCVHCACHCHLSCLFTWSNPAVLALKELRQTPWVCPACTDRGTSGRCSPLDDDSEADLPLVYLAALELERDSALREAQSRLRTVHEHGRQAYARALLISKGLQAKMNERKELKLKQETLTKELRQLQDRVRAFSEL